MSEISNSGGLFERGKAHFEVGNYDEAIKCFQDAIGITANNADYFAWLARALNSADNYGGASEAANRAIQLDQNNVMAYRQRGFVYEQQHDYQNAIQDYSYAIKLDPQDAIALYLRGSVYDDIGESSKAIADLTQAIKVNPKDTDSLYLRGFVNAQQSNYREAIQDYTLAIKLEPAARVYVGRGKCFYEQGETDRAIEDYSQAIRLDPNHEEAYRRRAHAYTDQKNLVEAFQDYSQALKLNPESSRSYSGRGFLEALRGNYQKAIEDVSEAIRLDPEYEEAYQLRGSFYLDANQPTEAALDFSHVLRINPNNAEAQEGLSTARKIASGEIKPVARPAEAALKLFDQAIDLLQSAGGNINERQKRDVISLLVLAVSKANAPFPDANALLAMLSYELQDSRVADVYASKALEQNPNEFRAQFVKVQIALDKVQVLTGSARSLLPRGIGAQQIFGALGRAAKAAVDTGVVTATQVKFKSEVDKLLAIFRSLCIEPLGANEFVYYASQLMSLADAIVDNKIPVPGGRPNIYAEVANAPISKLVYGAEDMVSTKVEIERTRTIASGRSLSFK